MINIKKRTLGFILLSGICIPSYAQQGINFGDFSRPVPSVSSLAAYNTTPSSNATGIPDISIPLLELPSGNNSISLSTGLSYNPLNVSQYEPASQVGTGWSLFAGGVISRSIVNDIDEMYDDASSGNYHKNYFDDIYYYNLPGISGKFKFTRNTQNNTFELVNLSSNRIKIEYTRTANTATLIPDSFTITDTRGIKYTFNDYSRSNMGRNVHIPGGKVYNSAFFLTHIKDSNNVELANFTYQKDIKYKNDASTILYETSKLKTVTSPGFGKIEFEYVYDPSMENTMNDPYYVQKVLLKDSYNHVISGYTFEYSQYGYNYSSSGAPINSNYKRILTKLKELNTNNTVSEITEFEYGDAYSPPASYGIDPSSLCYNFPIQTIPLTKGILKKIINPTGGVVEYNFEPNQQYIDRTEPFYLNSILSGDNFVDGEVQYLSSFNNTQYNTNNTTNYTFTVTGSGAKKIYVTFGTDELFPVPPFWDVNTPAYVDYIIKKGTQTITGETCGSEYSAKEYVLDPGVYTLQIVGSGGRGSVEFFKIEHITQPFKNSKTTNGVRLANIKYYNSKTEATPIKTTRFEYNQFSDSNSSSGYVFYPELDPNAEGYVLYKNVKTTNIDDNNGYIKYYYKTPNDYPSNGTSWPSYSFTSSGLLDKKEIYNAQNKLLAANRTDYTFEDIPGTQDYNILGTSGLTSKRTWLKKTVSTSTTYFDNNQSTEEQSETNYNVYNFETASTKKVVDGSLVEQFFTYPESGYAQLSNAHILSAPVMVEEKNNGLTVSKAETRYENTSSTRPTSVRLFNINDGTVKATKIYDLYDTKGNVIQMTSEAGIPVTTVYGYNQTLPIARIEGATYAQVSALVQPIIDASNADAQNPSNEAALITALENFRKNPALLNTYITTYTYDPLIGITTTTSPNGMRQIYRYNSDNQLEKIVDMNGVTLKEYQYNNKN